MEAPAISKPDYEPCVLVDTKDLSEEEWLEFRRHGIGGSDAAAVLGISPFRTARDLYYDKLKIVSAVEDEGNWVALQIGHLLEYLVAQIFQKKTGFRVFQIKKMFYHPQYPFMLADVDYFVELPDGTMAILEIKTTNYNAKDHWWYNGKEIVPIYYESQGRHYMAVMNINRIFFCCLYGNNENEVIIRDIKRDFDYESELIALEENFWRGHVLSQVPPPYTEDGDLIIESARRHFGQADPQAPELEMDLDLTSKVIRYQQLVEQKKNSEILSKQLDAELQRLKGAIIAEMGPSCKASAQKDGLDYIVTYNPVRKEEITKDNLLRLKLQYPDIYAEFVTVNESRRFSVKSRTIKAA